MAGAGGGGVSCPETGKLCGNSSMFHCYNEGVCCQVKTSESQMFCACPTGWTGDLCIQRDEMYDFMLSRDKTIQIISLSSAISIAVGIIALVALGVITLVIVRNYRKRQPWGFGPLEKEPDLDRTIIYVQEEISKLSTVQQLNKLQRLSKLFEKTVREAILSEPGHQMDRPKSVMMNDHLPRWSSAPTCINRPADDLDFPDGGATADDDDVFQKTKLQQVFSLPAPPVQTYRATSRL